MTIDIDDTIVAIASAEGAGMRGIVRVTGPDCLSAIRLAFADVQLGDQPQQIPATILLGGQVGHRLEGQLLVWPDERSYTQQPSAEFHTIGSRPLLDMVLEQLCESGCRLARPGEFTLRAFLGGRLDLTQAEAVLGLIDAKQEKQFDIALRQLAGGLATPMDVARDRMIDLLAELEAGLDFVEEDIEFVSKQQTIDAISATLESVEQIQDQIGSREIVAGVHDVVLMGSPNAGKSSLFNRMVASDRAIVADVAGTTRDYVSVNTQRNGLNIRLIDTAGLDPTHNSSDAVEVAAQRASQAQIESAHLKVVCVDSSRAANDLERDFYDSVAGDDTIFVLTKCDLERQSRFDRQPICTSAEIGKIHGLESLWDEICARLLAQSASDASVIGSTLVRCRQHIGRVISGLEAARAAAIADTGEEIVAAELRIALDHLGQIVGKVYTDDILERIFGRFCIGK